MQHHIDNRVYHIEILAPKQDSPKLEEDLERFAGKYQKVLDAGYVACITDNPMGMLSFQATASPRTLGAYDPCTQKQTEETPSRVAFSGPDRGWKVREPKLLGAT